MTKVIAVVTAAFHQRCGWLGALSAKPGSVLSGISTRQGIELARSVGDNGTRELLERMLVSEEKHANWLEEQLSLIAQVGEQNYLAQQIKDEK